MLIYKMPKSTISQAGGFLPEDPMMKGAILLVILIVLYFIIAGFVCGMPTFLRFVECEEDS